MILMDKMKEHSCAIQPAFGVGGVALNGLNFAMMFDQIFNPDNLLAPDDEPDGFDQPIFIQQIDGLFPVPDILPQPLIGPAATALQQSIQATEQAFQGANQPVFPQPQLTVAELVANAVQQHIATHHAAQTQSNNGPQPNISVTEMIYNHIQEQLTPPGSIGFLTAPLHLEPLAQSFIPAPIATSNNQSQANGTVYSANAFQNFIAAAESEHTHIYQQITSHSSTSSDISGNVPDIVPEVHNSVAPAPPDEESNSSIPPFHAPVSSPAHLYYSNDFNPSDEEGYAPALVESNILVIDSAGNSDNVDEN